MFFFSFGWMYQVNSGVLISKMIQPDNPIKFWQPSCRTPCNPKTTTYKNKRYFVLGVERHSTYTKHEFTLDLPHDFVGAPIESKFCGNTININTMIYGQFWDYAGRQKVSIGRAQLGAYQRNVEIDTRTVPKYDVDLRQFSRGNDKPLKRHKIGQRQKDVVQELTCEPDSDRINIDRLDRLSPWSGIVIIRTGAGRDVLSINGMIGKVHRDYRRENYLDADLGEGVNMLSLGAALNVEAKNGYVIKMERRDFLAGVQFDNTEGNGKVCYIKGDFKSKRCVGNVKGVSIFKGSR